MTGRPDVVIDLGELAPGGGAGRFRGRTGGRSPRRFRTLLAVLTIVLLAGLAAAAANQPPVRPTIVPARLGDMMFVGSDRFFLVSGGIAQNRTIRGYALPSGRPLSRTTVPVSGAIFDVTVSGDTILVSSQTDTIGSEVTLAVSAGTGVARWRRPARVVGVSAADGLVLLRENSLKYGDLHWYGIDLATGSQRWELVQPADGYITEMDSGGGFPRRLVVADSSGHLQIRDTLTGRVTTSGTFTVPADWARQGIALWPDGDLILIGGHRTATAYGLADLQPRWTTAVDLYAAYVGPDCLEEVCLFSPRSGGMLVVDRATGRRRWASRQWSYAERVGRYLLAGADSDSGGNQALSVVDPATGRVHGDFGRWQSLGPPSDDGTVVGVRSQADGTLYYARLDPVRLTTEVLGVADHISGDCQTTDRVLICRRTDASVAIWPLSGR